mmetsp:Transcript_6834/g.10346  ORF Transcript_6834/g.10346 Transcript_6834/m.10346 type:complete len:212 (-) Transcript_6834:20-655(-)
MIHILSSVDQSLGRVDKASFTQQTLMEILIENIEVQDSIVHGESITQWFGVSMRNDSVDTIRWLGVRLGGSIDFRWLPPTLTSINAVKNDFSGETCLTELPPTLQVFNISENHFCGSLDLTTLPESLTSMCVSGNNFSGSIDLTKLPKSLASLSLQSNPLDGEADFSQLPDALIHLNVIDTGLTGSLFIPLGKRYFIAGTSIKVTWSLGYF